MRFRQSSITTICEIIQMPSWPLNSRQHPHPCPIHYALERHLEAVHLRSRSHRDSHPGRHHWPDPSNDYSLVLHCVHNVLASTLGVEQEAIRLRRNIVKPVAVEPRKTSARIVALVRRRSGTSFGSVRLAEAAATAGTGMKFHPPVSWTFSSKSGRPIANPQRNPASP